RRSVVAHCRLLLLSLAGANALDPDSFRGFSGRRGLAENESIGERLAAWGVCTGGGRDAHCALDGVRGLGAPGGGRPSPVSDARSRKYPGGPNPVWLLLLLVVFALITLAVGFVARQAIRGPEAAPLLPSLLR